MYLTPGGSERLVARPNTYVNRSTNMIGWIVENTSRSGWRTKRRRLRTVTTRASVTSPRSSRGVRRLRRGGGVGAGRTAGLAGAAGTLTLVGAGGPSPAATSAFAPLL